MSKEGHIGIV